jgi:hypothetical protein
MKPLRPEDVLALVRGGALLLVAGAALRSLEWLLSRWSPILPAVIGAFLLDLWAQRIGARWMAPDRARSGSLSTFFAGAGTGLALGLFVVLAAAGLGAAHVAVSQISVRALSIGLLRIAAYAFRDELLFRGVPLALVGGRVGRSWSIAFSAALGAAPLLLSSGPAAIALAAVSGVFFALIWQVGAGGFAAWATHAGFRVASEVVAGGSILEVTYEKGALSSTEGAAGLPAYLAILAFALSAVTVYRRTQ